jgi:deoxyribodipyrimidine photolyase-related protein
MKAPQCRTLRLVLGDQLNPAHSWFDSVESEVLYVIAELRQEATYVRHHAQKVAAFFAAMQAFAEELEEAGHRVLHLDLDATEPFATLPQLLTELLRQSGAKGFEYQRPDEYRLQRQMETYCRGLGIDSRSFGSEHFLLARTELDDWFPAGKKHLMEHFYRRMRRRLGILVDEAGQPEGGRWNFDQDNRKRLPATQALPEALVFANPVAAITDRIQRHGIAMLGRLPDGGLDWPVNRQQSLRLLQHFIDQALAGFGRFQDAMSERDWLLFHSRLSFSLNTKMLAPAEVVDAVLSAHRQAPVVYALAAVEGFIRQVIGWREYMRGMYWTHMPEYGELNHFDHHRPLPPFYWSGSTRMACMAQAIGQSLDHAYAHHIQRLMVTGNFALLAGVHPDEVDAWYLGIYIDAIEWVEMPNTRGMSQFADGGLVATKPYVSSGSYINRMSDHCRQCHYRVAEKTGPTSCPFNSLYWHFIDRHRARLADNPRMGMMYRTWDKMGPARQSEILLTAEAYLANIDTL